MCANKEFIIIIKDTSSQYISEELIKYKKNYLLIKLYFNNSVCDYNKENRNINQVMM